MAYFVKEKSVFENVENYSDVFPDLEIMTIVCCRTKLWTFMLRITPKHKKIESHDSENVIIMIIISVS